MGILNIIYSSHCKTKINLSKLNKNDLLRNNEKLYSIPEFESSKTLQTSSISYSIPKTNRFSPEQNENLSYFPDYKFPDPNKYKGPSIGYGNKTNIINQSLKDLPSSQSYDIKSIFENNLSKNKGFTIGEKKDYVFIIFIKKGHILMPGPGAYESHNLNYGKYPITIKERKSLCFG